MPPGVAELSANAKPWHLIGWKDFGSQSIGIARKHQAISIDVKKTEGLSICFMRRAKGPGFVSFEAKFQENRGSVVFFEVAHFDEDALSWLRNNADKLESLFGMPLAINDFGSDY